MNDLSRGALVDDIVYTIALTAYLRRLSHNISIDRPVKIIKPP
ncbi:hypothetical protein P4S72_20420 [Vibrio sp. PP-XX7]